MSWRNFIGCAGVVLASGSAARAEGPGDGRAALTCFGTGTEQRFALMVRSGDYVPYDGIVLHTFHAQDTLRALGEEDERGRFSPAGSGKLPQLSKASLELYLPYKSCALDKDDPAHLGQCAWHAAKKRAHSLGPSQLHLEYGEYSVSGARQEVTVVRELDIDDVVLKATVEPVENLGKKERHVIVRLTVQAKVAGQPRSLSLTEDVGEWTAATDRSDYERCRYIAP